MEATVTTVADLLCQIDELSPEEEETLVRLTRFWEIRVERRRALAKRLLDDAGACTELSTENPARLLTLTDIAKTHPMHRNTVKYHLETGNLRPAAVSRDNNAYGELCCPLFTPEEVERWWASVNEKRAKGAHGYDRQKAQV